MKKILLSILIVLMASPAIAARKPKVRVDSLQVEVVVADTVIVTMFTSTTSNTTTSNTTTLYADLIDGDVITANDYDLETAAVRAGSYNTFKGIVDTDSDNLIELAGMDVSVLNQHNKSDIIMFPFEDGTVFTFTENYGDSEHSKIAWTAGNIMLMSPYGGKDVYLGDFQNDKIILNSSDSSYAYISANDLASSVSEDSMLIRYTYALINTTQDTMIGLAWKGVGGDQEAVGGPVVDIMNSYLLRTIEEKTDILSVAAGVGTFSGTIKVPNLDITGVIPGSPVDGSIYFLNVNNADADTIAVHNGTGWKYFISN